MLGTERVSAVSAGAGGVVVDVGASSTSSPAPVRTKTGLFGFRRTRTSSKNSAGAAVVDSTTRAAGGGGGGGGSESDNNNARSKSLGLLRRTGREAAAVARSVGASSPNSTSSVPLDARSQLTTSTTTTAAAAASAADTTTEHRSSKRHGRERAVSAKPLSAGLSRSSRSISSVSPFASLTRLRGGEKKLSWCFVCGKAVQSSASSSVTIQVDGGEVHVHDSCFCCSSCHRPLVSETFRHDNAKLYCSRHHGGYAQLGSALSLPRNVAKSSTARSGRAAIARGAHQRARSCGGLLTSPNHIASEPSSGSKEFAGKAEASALGVCEARDSEEDLADFDRDSITPTNSGEGLCRVKIGGGDFDDSETNEQSSCRLHIQDRLQTRSNPSSSDSSSDGRARRSGPDAGTCEGQVVVDCLGPQSSSILSPGHEQQQVQHSRSKASNSSTLERGENPSKCLPVEGADHNLQVSSSVLHQKDNDDEPVFQCAVHRSDSETEGALASVPPALIPAATTRGHPKDLALSQPVTPEPTTPVSPLPPRPGSVGPPVAPRKGSRFGHFVRTGRSGSVQAHVQDLMHKAESQVATTTLKMQPTTKATTGQGPRMASAPVGGRIGGGLRSDTHSAGVRTTSQLPRTSSKTDQQGVVTAAGAGSGDVGGGKVPKSGLPQRIGTPRSKLPPPTAAKPTTVTSSGHERTAGGIALSGSRCTTCTSSASSSSQTTASTVIAAPAAGAAPKTTTAAPCGTVASTQHTQQHTQAMPSKRTVQAADTTTVEHNQQPGGLQKRTPDHSAAASARLVGGKLSKASSSSPTRKQILSPQRSYSSSSIESAASSVGPGTVTKPLRQASAGSLSTPSSRLQSPSRSAGAGGAGGHTSPLRHGVGSSAAASGVSSKSAASSFSGAAAKTKSRPPPLTSSGEDTRDASPSSQQQHQRGHCIPESPGSPSLPKSPLARSSSAGCALSPSRRHGNQSATSAGAATNHGMGATAENVGVSSLTRRGMLMAAKYKAMEMDQEEKTKTVAAAQDEDEKQDTVKSMATAASSKQATSSMAPGEQSRISKTRHSDDESSRTTTALSRFKKPPKAKPSSQHDVRETQQQQPQKNPSAQQNWRQRQRLTSDSSKSSDVDGPQTQSSSQQHRTTAASLSSHREQVRRQHSGGQNRQELSTTTTSTAQSSSSSAKQPERTDSHKSKSKGSSTTATTVTPPPRACPYREDLPSIIDDSFLDDLQVYKAMCQDVVEQAQTQEETNASGSLQNRLNRQRSPSSGSVLSASSTLNSNGGGVGAAGNGTQIHIQLRNEDFQPAAPMAAVPDDWTTVPVISVVCGYYSEPLKSIEYSNSFHRHSVRRNSSKKRRKPSSTSTAAAKLEPVTQYYAIEVPLEEAYKTYFIGKIHWNFYVEQDADIGPCVLSLKQESSAEQERFRVLVRSSNCISHGCLPATSLLANPYIKEEVVASIGKEIGVTEPFSRTTFPTAEQELLRIDESFNSRQMKIGLVYVAAGQTTEEEMFNNRTGGVNFETFMSLLGDRVKLKRFGGYRGGLDVEYEQTGEDSLYSEWNDHQIMFHVAPLLPHHETDRQQVQKKRHIGNDMVLVVFVDDCSTPFNPTCIRSHFLHTFVVVHRHDEHYRVDVVARESVPLFGPPLWRKNVFPIKTDYEKEDFREFFMTKLVNAYRASLKAPKFLAMKTRTTSQMLSELTAQFSAFESMPSELRGVTNHAARSLSHSNSMCSTTSTVTGAVSAQCPPQSPSISSSWIPTGARRMSTPLPERSKQEFHSLPQLSRDLHQACRDFKQCCDVSFIVGERKYPLPAVRAILVVRSAAFRQFFLEPRTPSAATTTIIGSSSSVADSMASLDMAGSYVARSGDLASLALEGTSEPPLMARKGLRASARFKLRSGTGNGSGGSGSHQQRKNSNLSSKSHEGAITSVTAAQQQQQQQQRQSASKASTRRKSSSKSGSSSSNLFWGDGGASGSSVASSIGGSSGGQGFDSGAAGDEGQGLERSLSWQNLRPSSSTPHLLDDCLDCDSYAVGTAAAGSASAGGAAGGVCGRPGAAAAMMMSADMPAPRLADFLRQLAPGIQVFEVSEFSEESFSSVLDYIHTGSCDITAYNLTGVLCAAALLHLTALEKTCMKLAARLLADAGSVIQVLAGCEVYLRRHPLANMLFDSVVVPFIVSTRLDILSEPGITSLGQESMRRLYTLKLHADDTTRFRAAALWAEAESHRQISAVERGTRTSSEVMSSAGAMQQHHRHADGVDTTAATGGALRAGTSVQEADSMLAECSRESLRKQLIAPLVRDVSLRKISAADLMKLVLPTGAFPPDQVMMALAFQADPSAAAYFGVGEKSPKNARTSSQARQAGGSRGNSSSRGNHAGRARNASTPQPGQKPSSAASFVPDTSSAVASAASSAAVVKGGSLASRQRRQYTPSPTPSSPNISSAVASSSSARDLFTEDSTGAQQQPTRLTPSPTRSRRRLHPSSLGRSSASLSPRRPSLQSHPQLGGGGGDSRMRRSERVTSVPDVTAATKCETPLSTSSPPPFFNSPDMAAVASSSSSTTSGGSSRNSSTPAENTGSSSTCNQTTTVEEEDEDVAICTAGTESAAEYDLERDDVVPPTSDECPGPSSPRHLNTKRGSNSSSSGSGGAGNRLKVTAL